MKNDKTTTRPNLIRDLSLLLGIGASQAELLLDGCGLVTVSEGRVSFPLKRTWEWARRHSMLDPDDKRRAADDMAAFRILFDITLFQQKEILHPYTGCQSLTIDDDTVSFVPADLVEFLWQKMERLESVIWSREQVSQTLKNLFDARPLLRHVLNPNGGIRTD
jgi:hypothetical protein